MIQPNDRKTIESLAEEKGLEGQEYMEFVDRMLWTLGYRLADPEYCDCPDEGENGHDFYCGYEKLRT